MYKAITRGHVKSQDGRVEPESEQVFVFLLFVIVVIRPSERKTGRAYVSVFKVSSRILALLEDRQQERVS